MSHIARLIAQAAGMGAEFVETLFNAAPMHDIGKIGIPDSILFKSGRLEPEEWAIMRRHTEIGAKIIGRHDDDLLKAAHSIALHHHEKWDGSGYPPRPRGGEEIPLMARIAAVADVFDALTSARPYKKAWPLEEAVGYIEAQAGTHFDPALIGPFRRSLGEIARIVERYADHQGPCLDFDP
ncbi:HD-GYP domain-containing protein [Azotobacter vinelandii]